MNLIDRDSVKQAMQDRVFRNYTDEFWGVMQVLEEAPTVDAEPVRHGHWVKKKRTDFGMRNRIVAGRDKMGIEHEIICDGKGIVYDELLCSECGAIAAYNSTNFCPRCGVKMDAEEGAKR